MIKDQLYISNSTLPDAGKGLFTKCFIAAGTRIIEYLGKITPWKEVEHREADNGYIMYVNRNHVINAKPYKKSLARYANDAKGIGKVKGLHNNAVYITVNKRVFIQAVRDIKPGEEILVDYGKEYWQTIAANHRIDAKKKKDKAS